MDKFEKVTMYKLRKKAGYWQKSIIKCLPDTADRAQILRCIDALCIDVGKAILAYGVTQEVEDSID